MNKLTVERFGSLFQQLIACGISTLEHVEILIDELLEKATKQHHFIPMYADLCELLNDWCLEQPTCKNSETSFKRLLLTRCQIAFERHRKQLEHSEELCGDDLFEAQMKCKTARLGNLKFIGELVGKKMLAGKVVIHIVQELLGEAVDPQSLESLAAFLTAIGGMCDLPTWQHHKELNLIFEIVGRHSRDTEQVPSRIRCLLTDVLDLRATGWQDQKRATKAIARPMTLEEAHSQAAEM